MRANSSRQFVPPLMLVLAACSLCLNLSRTVASANEPREVVQQKDAVNPKEAGSSKEAGAWKPLFNGKSLDGWKAAEFGGEGEVTVKDGMILLDFGSSMTGITLQKEFPKSNYELRLEAKRVDGIDFFCGLTFPVKDSHCSFIVGGWGGAVVGLSSIDGKDASENDTTKYMRFEKDQWYKIRVRVTDNAIQTWIDDKQIVNQDIRNRKISIRNEVDLSKPLGISTWDTRAALRKLAYRSLAKKP